MIPLKPADRTADPTNSTALPLVGASALAGTILLEVGASSVLLVRYTTLLAGYAECPVEPINSLVLPKTSVYASVVTT